MNFTNILIIFLIIETFSILIEGKRDGDNNEADKLSNKKRQWEEQGYSITNPTINESAGDQISEDYLNPDISLQNYPQNHTQEESNENKRRKLEDFKLRRLARKHIIDQKRLGNKEIKISDIIEIDEQPQEKTKNSIEDQHEDEQIIQCNNGNLKSVLWDYYSLYLKNNVRYAHCKAKNCDYETKFPKNCSRTKLYKHLKNHKLFDEFIKRREKQNGSSTSKNRGNHSGTIEKKFKSSAWDYFAVLMKDKFRYAHCKVKDCKYEFKFPPEHSAINQIVKHLKNWHKELFNEHETKIKTSETNKMQAEATTSQNNQVEEPTNALNVEILDAADDNTDDDFLKCLCLFLNGK